MAESGENTQLTGLLDDIGPDTYVRIESDLIVVGDSIITDRHHQSGDNYEEDEPQNQIGGIIPAFSLSGWLRHGMEALLRNQGGSVCHPGEASANFRKSDVYERDLDADYHEKGACVDDSEDDDGCLILDLFGGFANRPGKFMRRPIQFSPVRGSVDYTKGQAEGHYRRLNRNIVSRNEDDNRTPLRNTELDAVANVDGCWHLSFRELKPEFIGLLDWGLEYLDRNKTNFMHQMGGARNFGAGIIDTHLINPLYTEDELSVVFNRSRSKTNAMEEKDERWESEYRPAFRDAVRDRIDEG